MNSRPSKNALNNTAGCMNIYFLSGCDLRVHASRFLYMNKTVCGYPENGPGDLIGMCFNHDLKFFTRIYYSRYTSITIHKMIIDPGPDIIQPQFLSFSFPA